MRLPTRQATQVTRRSPLTFNAISPILSNLHWEDGIFAVKKVISYRVRKRDIQFLVEWAGSKGETSWVTELSLYFVTQVINPHTASQRVLDLICRQLKVTMRNLRDCYEHGQCLENGSPVFKLRVDPHLSTSACLSTEKLNINNYLATEVKTSLSQPGGKNGLNIVSYLEGEQGGTTDCMLMELGNKKKHVTLIPVNWDGAVVAKVQSIHPDVNVTCNDWHLYVKQLSPMSAILLFADYTGTFRKLKHDIVNMFSTRKVKPGGIVAVTLSMRDRLGKNSCKLSTKDYVNRYIMRAAKRSGCTCERVRMLTYKHAMLFVAYRIVSYNKSMVALVS
jgi:hypothetical protein